GHEPNFTASFHMHFLELLIHTPMHLTMVLLLGTDLVAPFGIIWMTVDYLAHSNVRVDMGRLTYVLCTPQAHRVHHSADPKHFHTNFGNTIMLWDHVFGTFLYDPANPPTTYGVNDHVPVSFWKQQVLRWSGFRVMSATARGLYGPGFITGRNLEAAS